MEGVFDFWLFRIHPHILLGFIVTDTVGVIGGALFPFSYHPDRILPLHEAIKVVLSVERHYLPLFNSSLFVLVDCVGRVLDEWVVYQQGLNASVIFYESVKSVSLPHKILIMLKDPYYVTSIVVEFEKSDHDASEDLSKKRKFASSQKGKAKVLRNVSGRSGGRSSSDQEAICWLIFPGAFSFPPLFSSEEFFFLLTRAWFRQFWKEAFQNKKPLVE
ncbi:GHKL domain-containing protein [Sesbania bispinosa]|nr:GHKL domain-containing protein [Sesbania bispinosa]